MNTGVKLYIKGSKGKKKGESSEGLGTAPCDMEE